MKLIIDIDEWQYQEVCRNKGSYDIAYQIANGTPLPENPTNGDVIKALFPNAKIERGLYGISGTPMICLNLGTRYDVHEMSFVKEWWNAPYKAESEE